jgi:hypothetical protein
MTPEEGLIGARNGSDLADLSAAAEVPYEPMRVACAGDSVHLRNRAVMVVADALTECIDR